MKHAAVYLCIIAAGLLVAGCETVSDRDVVSVENLGSGTVACADTETGQPGHRQLLWRAHDRKRGCSITVTYRGTEHCQARLEYEQTGERSMVAYPQGTNYGPLYPHMNPYTYTNTLMWSTPRAPTTRAAGTNEVAVTLQDVTAVWLLCGDRQNPHEGGCTYTIDEIDCSRGSQQTYQSRTTTAALFTTNLSCGVASQVVWTAPPRTNAPGLCTVTVVLKGSRTCLPTLTAADHFGNVQSVNIVWDLPTRLTLHDVNQLSLKCSGSGGGEGCTMEIIQTECAR